MDGLESQDDSQLLRRMAGGDEAAFVALYRRHQGVVYRFALAMSGSGWAAEEVTQEVFLALLREAGRYDSGRGSLAGYLVGIARHGVLKRRRKEWRHEPLDGERAARGDLAQETSRRLEVELVRRSVAALPPRYREVVVLCELEGLSYEEAAAAVGCPVGTVRSRLSRARALLAGKLRAAGARKEAVPCGS